MTKRAHSRRVRRNSPQVGRRLKRTTRRILAVGAGIAALAVGTTMTPVFAFGSTAACAARSESTVFSRWGDNNNYFLMPNGTFENGTNEWKLTGTASQQSGNESYNVAGSGHSKSLRLPAGSTAESRTICVTRGEDSIRLFVKAPTGAPGSILHVDVVVKNPKTGALGYSAFDVNASAFPTGWAPTMRLNIPNLLSGTTTTQEITLNLSVRGTAATWSVDDVYVDPFKSY